MKPVNLLPESQRRRRPEGGGNSSYLVLGVLVALLVMTALYVTTANKATSRANATAAASAEAEQLEARANELGAFGDFAQIKETRVASVRQLADARFDWERLMREVSRVLPSGGWFKTVNASTTGDLGESDESVGSGPSATFDGLTGVPSLNGCGRFYQFDVSVTFAPVVPREAPDGRSRVPASLGGGS